MYKFKASRGSDWLRSFLQLIISLRRNHIHPIFVLDGKPPVEKEEERHRRRQERDKIRNIITELELALEQFESEGIVAPILDQLWKKRKSPPRLLAQKQISSSWIRKKIKQKQSQLFDVGQDDFAQLRLLCNKLGVSCIEAPDEAEKRCAQLCLNGQVKAVLSEDTDLIAYGTPLFLTKIDLVKDTVVALDNTHILSKIGLDSSQLLDLCIMCGTDYNPNIPKIGPHSAYKYIQKYQTIDSIPLDTSVLTHQHVRTLFTQFPKEDQDFTPKYCPKIPRERLVTALDGFSIRSDQFAVIERQLNPVSRYIFEEDKNKV
jgi:5'-3' exonuclease